MNDPRDEATTALMARVHTGMKVFDADGKELGAVDELSMGDPQAATTEGNEVRPSGGVLRDVAEAVSDTREEPDAPEPLRSRLVREGYIKLKRGVFRSDIYVSGEQIGRVDGDRVTLTVRRDELES
ncbi:MAG: hypothetical protein JO023_09390 [Chloroflexi bacterium]|nr:hypothetical protein [Chloroflexota bacterium]